MKKIYIFGMGKGKAIVDRCLKNESVEVLGYIDNYKKGDERVGEVPIIYSKEIGNCYDAIIITLIKYNRVKKALMEMGVPENKIICFFSVSDAQKEENWDYINPYKWKTELMWENYNEFVIPTIENYSYELYWEKFKLDKQIPNILSASETVDIIKKERKCLARFGDGEFELILGRNRARFQCVNEELRARLKEVLQTKQPNILIAIADNYGSLAKYTDEAATDIRQYMGNGTRQEHMQLLDLDRTYYNAYLSRPYILHRDKTEAKRRFEEIREVWDNKEILIVEGEHTRFGVGNDLLSNAKSVKRILTLDKDCFSVYDQLLETVKEYGENKLVLITLGPVATILAYDLAKLDYWAVDIGQLDVEYEWYLRKVSERCDIPYKTVSEVPQFDIIATDKSMEYIQRYESEIITHVR